MTLFCNKKFSSLQRRSLGRLSACLIFTAVLNMLAQRELQRGHTPLVAVLGMAALYVMPVALGVAVVGRYLAAEQDEFIRALVVRSLLWGFAITMSGDAVAELLMQYYSTSFPLALLNVDLLFASTGIAFRLQQRSYR